jgi:hypothetical protein
MFISYLLGCVFGVHPLRVVVVLPERAGAAVRAVVETAVDTTHWVGAGVTRQGCLPQRFYLGLRFAAHTKDSVALPCLPSCWPCA